MDSSTVNESDLAAAAELYPSLWVVQHDMKNESGFPIEFKKRRYLIDIYNDLSPFQVILKPPQVGMTVAMTLKSFYVANKLKRQIIYTLPTQGDVIEMVGGSINRIIAQNEFLKKWIKDHDTVEQKQVGESMIFYRGTFTAKQAMMVPSGLNIHDEVDASNFEVITQYENRLQAQEDGGWRWYFSHPSLAGHGVDVYWQKSDKKEWVITCRHCTKEQILVWPESINLEGSYYQCKYCKGKLEDEWRIKGSWKATAIGEFSGYHISQLMLYNKTAESIIESKNDPMKNEQFFYNYVLGLPYVGSENKISSETVLKNVTSEVNEQNDRIIIGVDPGTPIYFTCLNKQGAFYYGSCALHDELGKPQDPWDDIRKLMRRWPTSIVMVDGNGDSTMQRRLQLEFPGRVYLVFYRKDRKTKEMVTWGEGDDLGSVRVDRNQYFQWMVEQLRDVGRVRFNGSVEDWKPWAKHFDNVYREIKTALDKPGKDVASNYGVEFIWKRVGGDHYCHNLLFALVGLERFGTEAASFIKKDSFLKGIPKAVDNVGVVRPGAVFGRRKLPDGFTDAQF